MPTSIWNPMQPDEIKALVQLVNTEEYYPNGLKVSKTDNPLFFPAKSTYQVGSSAIIALCVNTKAVGTGQTGDAPLYVFCKDGVYAQFVDSSGEMAYHESRPLADDVCNNPRSVTRTDMGVVFTTDRGLMMMAGEQVQEIGDPAEGDVKLFWNSTSVDYIKTATGAMSFVAGLPPADLCDGNDFLSYLTGAIVNYNHNERELMISNPLCNYSYILDREGNWSRRNYTAVQYVNNYPTSYRITADGHFYKVDEEGDNNTSLEERKEADNKFFYLSNVVKLDSIGFKRAQRFVLRGIFETIADKNEGNFDPTTMFYDDTHTILHNMPGTTYEDAHRYMELCIGDTRVRVMSKETVGTDKRIHVSSAVPDVSNVTVKIPNYVGCYIFGSYDGRKWAMLGSNERTGKFTDIGCDIERTDVKFLRIALAGRVTGKTRIDYMEMSSLPSMLNTKIR